MVILERGRFSFGQYEEQISSRRDFLRCTRKDSEPERKVGARWRSRRLVHLPSPSLRRPCSRLPPAAGVFEEATPQGHSEQPRPHAELLSQSAVPTFRTSQSHQRAAVPAGSQRKHERHQDPECKGETRGLLLGHQWGRIINSALCLQEAMVIALKSLPPGTKLNVVGFGTTIKPLFASSKLSTDVSVTQ